jgi:ppGpp synthetase/RelA/SpoT-type nucleotidyltranferase
VTEPESVRDAFNRAAPLVADTQRYVRDTLKPYCRDQHYIFTDRRKTLQSLSEKLEGGRSRAWSELDDLYACTVVVPVSSHESSVVRKLQASFREHSSRSRSQTKKAPDVFRFDGLRWYGFLRDEAARLRQPGVGLQMFEVQVITAFEYAWITVTHDLVYKSNNVDWQRQRLAAQLKAAVEQIEVLIAAFDTASSVVRESPWPENEAKALIIKRCQMLFDDRLVPETLHPANWRRFADNFYALVRSFESKEHKLRVAVTQLLDAIDADLRGAAPLDLPVSGTFFQYVLSVVSRPGTPGHLDEFTVVPSRELTDLYRLPQLAKAFRFDGTAAPPAEPLEPESEDPA